MISSLLSVSKSLGYIKLPKIIHSKMYISCKSTKIMRIKQILLKAELNSFILGI
jgi:hypothetical protein